MKFSLTPIMASALLASTSVAFAPTQDVASFAAKKSSSTRLFISSWGSGGPPHRHEKRPDPVNPSENVHAYLGPPEPPTSKPNLRGGTVLVSGFANDDARTDQRMFDLLNDEFGESNFDFDDIVAFVDDAAFSKKRLTSRTARYSGLLNKLSFAQSDCPGGLPSVEQLRGVTSWVANVGSDLSLLKAIGELSVLADVTNVSVLVTDASVLNMYDSVGAVKTLRDRSYTVVAIGSATDEIGEGEYPYAISEFGTKEGEVAEGAAFSRDEGYRLVAGCLGLQCASGRAMTFQQVHDVNATETKLIKGLREAGYSWSQEMEHMIDDGAARFEEACRKYEADSANFKTEEMGWLEREEEKLREAQEAEIARQREAEERWIREREEMMAAERERADQGTAEWA
eukprot:CAMPEP_0183294528 /NCGR_PEP_ID=MMETSP0160_2-20130417/2835_1 /TAXON_ID=2839 ORGANISM="Odontella Sinensis, Strain Grunow 1884" /NCGR_SAMPLE_ID=MMETSP0160_2 /ASSEMBLY_ACC=CAM_ASM_000250 /LENGTH=397 /DNA_ID=CAMNT_0025455873 /DNA_START=253 /DNA_END=1446 /DNA_ORIENTATION=+